VVTVSNGDESAVGVSHYAPPMISSARSSTMSRSCCASMP
jgi:hypothetical protein